MAQVTDAPLAAAENQTQIAEKIQAYIASCQGLAADGVSVADFAQMVVGLLRVAVAAVDAFPVTGYAKKAWVLDSVGALFDAVASGLSASLPWPLWFLSRRTTRAIVLAAASGAIEILLPLVTTTEKT